jgi:hypothetical protein
LLLHVYRLHRQNNSHCQILFKFFSSILSYLIQKSKSRDMYHNCQFAIDSQTNYATTYIHNAPLFFLSLFLSEFLFCLPVVPSQVTFRKIHKKKKRKLKQLISLKFKPSGYHPHQHRHLQPLLQVHHFPQHHNSHAHCRMHKTEPPQC